MIWNRLRRWLTVEPHHAESAEPSLTWHEPGPDNPFGIRLLDCRPFTWNLVSTTQDPEIATRYSSLRENDGRDLIGRTIHDSVRVAASLTFPHNGAELLGIASKSDSMEVKWDTYFYDSAFLFARSWTGELRYRAAAVVGPSDIRISEIECCPEDAELAASAVYFLLATHAMGRVLPHQIPRDMEGEDPMTIAQWSFAQYGKLACYATAADVTAIPIAE